MAELVLPDRLDADTVVPQLADNQLVMEDVYRHMVTEQLDYATPGVRERREAAVRNEFLRALIYSTQVVVNRIGFRNNPFIYSLFGPESPARADFARLMRDQVIVPYFYRERSLTDGLDFSTTADGDAACEALADELQGDYSYVRLADDDATNRSRTQDMGRQFSNYFRNLGTLEVPDINEMASELFAQRPIEGERFEEFDQQLVRLETYALANTGRGKPALRREQVYKEFFSLDGTDPAEGKFRRPGERDDPHCLFELKKLVDLRYNATLPDLLGRYTFVPAGMPTRMALRDFKVSRQQITTDNFISFLERMRQQRGDTQREIRQIIHSEAQKALLVPIPSAFELADVVEIRQWPSWLDFAKSRRKLVEFGTTAGTLDGANLQEDYIGFIKSFYAFQRELGDWWIAKHPNAETDKIAKRVVASVSYGLKVGPLVLSFFAPELGKQVAQLKTYIDGVIPDGAKSAVKGVSLNLLTDMFDARTAELQSDLSMCVELLNDNLEADAGWLEATFGTAQELGGTQLSRATDRTDQNRNEDL